MPLMTLAEAARWPNLTNAPVTVQLTHSVTEQSFGKPIQTEDVQSKVKFKVKLDVT